MLGKFGFAMFLLFLLLLLFACLTFVNIYVIFMDRIPSTKGIPYVKYVWYGMQYFVLIALSVYNVISEEDNTRIHFPYDYRIDKRPAIFIFIIFYAMYLMHVPYIALMLMHNKDDQITYIIDKTYSPYHMNPMMIGLNDEDLKEEKLKNNDLNWSFISESYVVYTIIYAVLLFYMFITFYYAMGEKIRTPILIIFFINAIYIPFHVFLNKDILNKNYYRDIAWNTALCVLIGGIFFIALSSRLTENI
jgi:hypothetical protein